jgi:UDP-N-acetylglucosamine 4,6-dehydratase
MSGSILITGASGTFGTAFVKRLLRDKRYDRIVLLSRGEHRQAAMRAELRDPDGRLRFMIGDVRDFDRLRRAFSGVNVVVHAAALKRIEVCEYDPIEVVRTNVLGAVNVIEAALEKGVRKVVALSTDKCVDPINAYGASKLLAEKLFIAANNMRGEDGTVFAIARYGNIAGSNGSVIPTWRSILKHSDTVPVTNPEVTRFWMEIGEAVDLVLDTIGTMKGGEVAIPELPAYRLGDLVEAMDAKMQVRGLPDFEKLHESMEHGNSSDQARRMTVSEIRERLAAL